MQNLRQLGGGVIIAIFSIVLVIGGIYLSLAEALPAPATPTLIPPTLPLSLHSSFCPGRFLPSVLHVP